MAPDPAKGPMKTAGGSLVCRSKSASPASSSVSTIYSNRETNPPKLPTKPPSGTVTKPPEKKMHPDIQYYNWILGGSLVLCFNAGYVNGLTLSTIFHAPCAHVTGMVAQASHFTSVGDGVHFMQYAVSYLCFLTGAFTSGVVVQHEAFYLGRMYGRVLLMLAAVWGVALLIESHFDNTVFFVWVCAFSCGLQNGLTSKYSGNALRTTHLTGTTTDLGIALGHIFFQGKNEWWKVQVHLCAIVGFFLGGIGGNFAFKRYEHLALLLSICLSSFCGVLHTAYLSYHEHIPFLSVLESKQDIKLHRERVRGTKRHARRMSDSSDVIDTLCLSPRVGRSGTHDELRPSDRVPLQVMRNFKSDSRMLLTRHRASELAVDDEQKAYHHRAEDLEGVGGDLSHEDVQGQLEEDEEGEVFTPPEMIPEKEYDDDDVAANSWAEEVDREEDEEDDDVGGGVDDLAGGGGRRGRRTGHEEDDLGDAERGDGGATRPGASPSPPRVRL